MAQLNLHARVEATVGKLTVDVELHVGPETLVLVGPNGAGKSSLLKLILGVLPMRTGSVRVGDTVLCDAALGQSVPIEARRLAYVPQDYALFPHLSVRENVRFAVDCACRDMPRNHRAQLVDTMLEALGLTALGGRRPAGLSGGERQRVALARALSVSPAALLLDEPLAALDVRSRVQVREVLRGTLERLAIPTLLVTHDPVDARELGQRIAVLEAGRLTQLGTWQELAARPATPFVAELASTPGREIVCGGMQTRGA
jgi:molybdate transport system ATP-binding protein